MTRQITRHPNALTPEAMALLTSRGFKITPGPAESRWIPPKPKTAKQLAREAAKAEARRIRLAARPYQGRALQVTKAENLREAHRRHMAGEKLAAIERSLGVSKGSLAYHFRSHNGGYSTALASVIGGATVAKSATAQRRAA